uniref:Grass carp reovirus (GCRV)-induced gene 2j n=1 Tax=Sphaeramia orbicularis TaxID=375764 RepID=A0A672YMV3_9TELE
HRSEVTVQPFLSCSRPDGNGRTYVMYHGTTSTNAASIALWGFQRSADGMLGPGVYVSRDLQKASRYPINHPEHDKVVVRVLVKVGKVIAINYQGHPLQKTWHQYYDTAWVPPNCGMVKSGLEEDCVWDPSRIQIQSFIKPQAVPARPFYGKTYVMYHGTTSTNSNISSITALWGFQRSADGMLGPGVYVSRDLQKASRYPINHPEHDKVVVRVLVKVGKVIAINYQGHPLQKTWHQYYDTAWVPPNCGMVKSGLEEDCVWDPSRIQIQSFIKPQAVPARPFCGGGAWGYK